jgi:hypothetical protein
MAHALIHNISLTFSTDKAGKSVVGAAACRTSSSPGCMDFFTRIKAHDEPTYAHPHPHVQPTGCGFFKTGEFVCKPLQAWIFSR